jgi:hypothetical protein
MKSKEQAVVFAAVLFVGVMSSLAIGGCTASGDNSYHSLTDSEWDSISKLRSGQYTLMGNQELTTLRHDAEIGKSVGRYQIHNEGFRTWRLDTATGKTCILLTSKEDWKKPETFEQSCTLE